LSGLAISGCCAVYSDLAPEAPAAVVIFSVSGTVTAALLVALQGRSRRLNLLRKTVVPALPICVGAILGLIVASGLGGYPSPPRSEDDLICEPTDVADICFYPEQLWNASPEPVEIVAETLRNIRAAGIDTPARVTGSLSDGGDDALVMLYRRDFTVPETIHSLSSWFGFADPSLACPRDAENPEIPWVVSQVITSVVYHHGTSGQPEPFVNDPMVKTAVASVLAMPRDDQREWIALARESVLDCDVPLPEIAVAAQ
jgi:hypothetical protein